VIDVRFRFDAFSGAGAGSRERRIRSSVRIVKMLLCNPHICSYHRRVPDAGSFAFRRVAAGDRREL
jgi:hypothetical protein